MAPLLGTHKIHCQPTIVSKHLSCETTLGFYEKNFCWVDVSLVSHTTAEFAVPLIRIFFVQKSLDFSTSPKSLNIESGTAISVGCFFQGNPWISGDIFLTHILFLSSFLYEIF